MRLRKPLPNDDVLDAALAVVWRRLPYFTRLLFRLKPVPTPGIGTVSVDDGLRLYYDPEFVGRCGVEYTPTLLRHEIDHPTLEHSRTAEALAASGWQVRYEAVAHILREQIGVDSWRMFLNWCGDAEINSGMDAAEWPWPPEFNPVLPQKHALPPHLTMTEYVALLIERVEKEAENEQQQGNEDAHAGSEGEGGSDAGGAGEGAEGADDPAGAPGADQDEHAPGGGAQDEHDDPAHGDDPGRDGDDHGNDAAPGGEGAPRNDAGGEPDRGGDGGDGGGADGAGDVGAGEPGRVGAGCCGGCAGRPLAHEGVGDLPDPATPEEREIIMRGVAADVLAYTGTDSRGTAPSDRLLRWAQAQFAPPKIDPYKVLARAVRGAMADARRRVDWRTGPPSMAREVMRRMPAWRERAPILPVLQGPKPTVFFIVDTSGSMGRGKGSRLEKAARETLGILKATGTPAYAMAVDSTVQAVRKVSTTEDVLALLKGGGGTNMAAGVRAASEQRPKPDLFILLTDGIDPGYPARADMPRGAQFVTVLLNESEHRWRQVPEHLRRDAVWVRE